MTLRQPHPASTAPGSSAPALEAAMTLLRQSQAAHIERLGLLDNGDLELVVRPESLLAVARFLRDDPALDFRYFSLMFGNDKIDHLECVYVLESFVKGIRLQLKVRLDPVAPKVDSVVLIWPGANWHERETFDMFGITFAGHPDHRRLFLEDDFQGYPMRKSFALAGRAE